MATAIQMNVRIDPDLKARGDKVLARRGLSPSQAVRALYEGIVGDKERSDEVFKAVLQNGSERGDKDALKKKKLKDIRKVQASIRDLGLMCDPEGNNHSASFMSDKELLESAIMDHYSSKDLLS